MIGARFTGMPWALRMLLASAMLPYISLSVAFCIFMYQFPMMAISVAIVLCTLERLLAKRRPNYRPPPAPREKGWAMGDPFKALRTGDVIMDELVGTGFFTSKSVKYGTSLPLYIETQLRHPDTTPRQRELCAMLLQQVNTVPDWVDLRKLEEAREVYKANIPLVSVGLAVALVESYAFPLDAEVLFIAGGLTTNDAATIRRLMETGFWVFSIFKEGLAVGGKGHASILTVRLLHAMARKKCLESPRWARIPTASSTDVLTEREEGQESDDDGEHLMREALNGKHVDPDIVLKRVSGEIPVNQATQVATLVLFCQVVMEVAEMRGADYSPQDKEAYWHFWRYVGYLLGVEDEFMPHTYYEGLATRESPLYLHRQRPNERSKVLSKGTIDNYGNLPNIPFHRGLFVVTINKFLGETLSRALDVEPVTFREAVHFGFTVFAFRALGLANKLLPPVRWVMKRSLFQFIDGVYATYFSTPPPSTLSASRSISTSDPSKRSKCPFGL